MPVQLLNKQRGSNADLVLGLFPAEHSEKIDMVDLDNQGFVRGIHIKPSKTRLKYTWIIAVWTSVFTHFMHEFVVNHLKRANSEKDMASVQQSPADRHWTDHGQSPRKLPMPG